MLAHADRYRSQYRRLKEIKGIVSDPINESKLIRTDWSENVDLYQTRQEKSVYYTSTSASINTAVLYTPDGVKGLGSISDFKCHKAPSTWASLTVMFKSLDFSNTQTLYI